MTRHSYSALLAVLCTCTFVSLIPSRALAQTPPAPASAAAPAAEEDDDAKLRPLDPDFTVINLPTTLPLPFKTAGNFHLTHRFVGVDWRHDDFDTIAANAFGFDGPAVIQLEYRIAVYKHLEAIVARTNFGRTIQFSGKYDARHEGAGHPIGVSIIASVEGQNNFQSHNTSGTDIGYTPAFGAAFSRTLGKFASVYLDPIFAHNTKDTGEPDRQNTFYIGVGGRLRLRPGTFFVGEVTPRASGYVQGTAEVAFSLEKQIGGHVFSIVFANTQATTFGQLARGASVGSDDKSPIYIGFNLARKFY